MTTEIPGAQEAPDTDEYDTVGTAAEHGGGDPAVPSPHSTPARGRDRVRTVAVGRIDPPYYDLRENRDPATIRALAEDIQRDTILQNPGACLLPDGRYRIVYGYSRLLAMRQLGRTKIDITLVECANEADEILAGLRENLARSDLSDGDFARAIVKLRAAGLQGTAIAEKLGLHATTVSRLHRTLRHPVLGPYAITGAISWGEAAAMLNVPPTSLDQLIQEVIQRRDDKKPMKIVSELRPRVDALRGIEKSPPTSAERLLTIRRMTEDFLSEGPSLDEAALGELRLLANLVGGELTRHS